MPAPERARTRSSSAGRRGGWTRWAVSLAATAASTYALDAAATAAGLLLVGSGALSGLPHQLLLAVLAASYLVWGWGLRASLLANRELLRSTGTSTNILSKAAHDLATRCGAGPARCRLAADLGYLATEVAKEVPYYAGAFGAAVLSSSVSSDQALVFLVGANLAAAGYEYGLARLTRAVLGRRYASFDTDWVPAEYLADYYTEVEPDEQETIAFFVDAIRQAEPAQPVLFFGVGPTLHHVFLAAGMGSEIHLGDYLPANLAEIRRWLDHDPRAHGWRPFVRYTLQCEGVACPTDDEITCREELTRAAITRLVLVDGRLPAPRGERYATVLSAYCADSATHDRAAWAAFMQHVMARVRPGGLFITAALRDADSYLVGGKAFPSARVDEHDLRSALESELGGPPGGVEARPLTDQPAHGYSGIVLAWARRTGGTAAAVSLTSAAAPVCMTFTSPASASPPVLAADPLPGLVGSELCVPLVDGSRRRYVNLDYAASAPCLVSVKQAVDALLPWYSSVHRGAGYKSQLATDAYEGARGAVRAFVGGRPDDVVVFTRNTTDAVNLLAAAVPQGCEVFGFAVEHHANLLPWRRGDFTLLPLPAGPEHALELLEQALRRGRPRPAGAGRLVTVTGASNVTGEIWPYAELAALAHRYGARLLLDAAQLAPHRAIDLAAADVDYLALSGHKLYAPFGAGALIGRPDWLAVGTPFLAGGGAVRYVGTDTVLWAELPDRQEAGSPNVVGAVALGAACGTLEALDRTALAVQETGWCNGPGTGSRRSPGSSCTASGRPTTRGSRSCRSRSTRCPTPCSPPP